MTKLNNSLPPYAEEITISQETEQIQETLNKFKQPIPSNFIQIEAEHVCSTKPNWEGKPLSERYSFTHGEKWIWIDIPHTLMEKLELKKGEDIKQPLHLDPAVLTRSKVYKGISIKNEEEIFIQKPLTINNLEENLTKLLERVKKLEEQEQLNQETITELKKELSEIEKIKNIWRNKYLEEKEGNNNIQRKLEIIEILSKQELGEQSWKQLKGQVLAELNRE